MREVLKINGHDYGPLIIESGISWTRNDLDSDDSGRTTMDGLMHRGRIAIKWKGTVKLRPLTQEQLKMVLEDIEAPFFEAEYFSPRYGLTTGTFYTNNVQMTLSHVDDNGVYKWAGVSFPLIER